MFLQETTEQDPGRDAVLGWWEMNVDDTEMYIRMLRGEQARNDALFDAAFDGLFGGLPLVTVI